VAEITFNGGLPVINARSYGATGNGVTDDTTAIQAAVNAIPSTGGQVFLPGGKYLISSTITLPPINSNLRGGAFVGAGHNATQLYLANSSNTDMVKVNGQFWTVRDMNLDGNYPNNASGGVGILVNFTKTVLQNLYIANAKTDGIQLVTASQPAHAALLSNIYVISCQSNGINASTGAYDLKANNIWIGSCGAAGLLINSTEQHWNNLHSWGNGAEGVKVTAGDHLRFTNCYFETNTSHGIGVNNAKGIMLSASHLWANVGNGAYLFNAPDCNITGCQITDNSNGVFNQDGIKGDGTSTDVSVTGCYFGIENDGGVTSHQKYAIETISSCDRWTIVGNNMRATKHATGSSALVGAANISGGTLNQV
jgi:hypothetical protein